MLDWKSEGLSVDGLGVGFVSAGVDLKVVVDLNPLGPLLLRESNRKA
ncbi:MAG: hypothetical protein GF353_15120 [Candidatus Lokiarchaeota archaeon]|nr:hypothetical protein [Candidatus Lokiarchaeota archaeon]